MSRARNLWWGYVRNILREYPRVTAEEHRAVSAAIQTTRSRRDGGERMRVVRMTPNWLWWLPWWGTFV